MNEFFNSLVFAKISSQSSTEVLTTV